jgi:hypothetical protein
MSLNIRVENTLLVHIKDCTHCQEEIVAQFLHRVPFMVFLALCFIWPYLREVTKSAFGSFNNSAIASDLLSFFIKEYNLLFDLSYRFFHIQKL